MLVYMVKKLIAVLPEKSVIVSPRVEEISGDSNGAVHGKLKNS